jgi:RNA polymerase sigma factor (sigma-70 family)
MTLHEDLLRANDSRLAAYLSATDEATRAAELAALLAQVQERVREILGAYVRAGWPAAREDVDEMVSVVTLRLLRKLRAAASVEEESLQNLEAYTTTLAKNEMRDFMRRRSPERARMKQRIRYIFTRDHRLVLSVADGTTVCALAAWGTTAGPPASAEEVAVAAQRSAIAAIDSADDAVALLSVVRKPVRLSDLVASLRHGEPPQAASADEAPAGRAIDRVEARQYLTVLWQEIRELPPRQRTALLLNLREPASGNAVTLFVLLGIATLVEIAEAVEMTTNELSAIWDDLPLDDLRIAAHLGVERQQVINMRKSARERLVRRMRHGASA